MSKNNVPITEYLLQYSWNIISPKTELYSLSGEKISVLFPGIWNFEEGPDFLSAKLSVDGEIIYGDIEIHKYPLDWLKHGHSGDSRYGNVVLHVVGDLNRDYLALKGSLPSILTLVLPDSYIQKNSSDKFHRYPYGLCASRFSTLSDSELIQFFSGAGVRRFCEKSNILTKEILEIGVNRTFLRSYFDSCGYKNNRRAFLELFERLMVYNLDSLSIDQIIAILWGESGLLPDDIEDLSPDMENFIKHNWEVWWKLRICNDKPIKWNFSGVRPLNTPCRRIAALSIFLLRFGIKPFEYIFDIFNSVNIIDVSTELKKLLICNDLLWDEYSSPSHKLKKKSAVLGEGRALDVLVNVIFPLIYAFCEINGLHEQKDKATLVWTKLPASNSNIILKICAQRWLIPIERAKLIFKSSAAQQGALYIYKAFCQAKRMDCAKCSVVKN